MDRGLDFAPVLVGLLVDVYLHVAVAGGGHGVVILLVGEVLVLLLDVAAHAGDSREVLVGLLGQHTVHVPAIFLLLHHVPDDVEVFDIYVLELQFGVQVGLDDALELRLFDYSVEGGLSLAVVDVFVVVVIAGIVGVVGVYISLVVWQPDSVAEYVLGEIVARLAVLGAGDAVV